MSSRVTLPRQILPQVRLVTRSCVGRQHLLHGGDEVNGIYEYLLAVACEKFNVGLVAYVAMSDHTHVVVHDPDARVCEWTAWLHAMVARSVNSVLGRWGQFWEGEQPNQPEMPDGAKVLEKVAYTLANPTLSGLVEKSADWIGARSKVADYLAPREVPRPQVPFFEGGTLPECATLRLVVPPTHAHMTSAEFMAEVVAAVAGVEEAQHRKMREAKRRYVGVRRLKALSWRRRATSARKRGRGTVKPTVLSTCAALRGQVLARLATFRVEHGKARAAFVAGEHEVMFPVGTYWMVRFMGATCHPPP